MRDIRFRAFNTKTGKMVDLYKITPLATAPEFDQDGLFIPFDEDYKLMQYTGLKDKNGKEIYEGDIVSFEYFDNDLEGIKSWGVVAEGRDEYAWYLIKNCNTPLAHKKICEVIGNIYENPDLVMA